MNIIPTTFNENITPYTAVGGKERIASTGISAVILNRPPLARRSFFQEIEKTGFDNVISIESCAPHYDIEELAGRFPFVRFILPEKAINLGEQINLGASEIQSPLFFVLRSDMKIIAGGTARRLAERLRIKKEENEVNPGFKRLCTVPILTNSNYEIFPSIVTPVTRKRKIQSVFLEPHNDGEFTLYPFDGIGIYDKQRFIHIGGYDTSLKEMSWQLMDFGFRSHLWGEEIAFSSHLKLSYEGELSIENSSIEENYRRFYLKNLAPVYRSDYAHLPLYRFISFMFNSGENIFSSWKEFRESRNWVIKNKFRWKCDARTVTGKWDK
ncbi:MAG: hypothetical protein FWD26_05795 [Treponema sp.]|nr:hypothetical protein [Treponema sp.]